MITKKLMPIMLVSLIAIFQLTSCVQRKVVPSTTGDASESTEEFVETTYDYTLYLPLIFERYPLKTELDDDSVKERLYEEMTVIEAIEMIGGSPRRVEGAGEGIMIYTMQNGNWLELKVHFSAATLQWTIYDIYERTVENGTGAPRVDSTTPEETTVPQTTE